MDVEVKKDILLKELKRISSYQLLPDEFNDLDICMFGIGQIGRFAFQGLQWYFEDRLKYVCDNDISNFPDRIYKGKQVLSVDELAEKNEHCMVIIATSEKYSYNIADQLKGIGVENIRIFNGDPITRFMDTCFAKYAYKMLPEVWGILSDDISKELLIERLSEIFYYIGLPMHSYVTTPQTFIPPELRTSISPLCDFYNKKQYFPEDIVQLSENECFVDGGAYIGDTINSFISATNNRFEKIYAFEVEPNNYEKCKTVHGSDRRIEIYPYGISDETKEVYVSLGKSTLGQHRISTNGDIISKAVSIDEILKNRRVTFIKMDIEGEELEALEGGKNTILTQKPTLAISAYHKASDIFDIPLWIKKINSEYKIYFRHHGDRCLYDTVCYGIIN